jgi:hypothetical protein
LDEVGGLNDKVDDLAAFIIPFQVWINAVSKVVVFHRLTIALEVLEDCCSVVEQVRVWLLQVALSLGVGFEGQFKFRDVFVVDEKVCQMRISKDIYRSTVC